MHYSDIRRYITHTRAVRGNGGPPLAANFRAPPFTPRSCVATTVAVSGDFRLNAAGASDAIPPPPPGAHPKRDIFRREVIYFCGFCKLFRFGLIVACFFGPRCKAECVGKLSSLSIKLMSYYGGREGTAKLLLHRRGGTALTLCNVMRINRPMGLFDK
jgi:hypothetical protein